MATLLLVALNDGPVHFEAHAWVKFHRIFSAPVSSSSTIEPFRRSGVAPLTALRCHWYRSVESLMPLVPGLGEEHYPAGTVIVSDVASATGTRRFVIVSGQAEVTAPGPTGAVPLATLGPGELFGEAAVLEPEGGRHAVITAQTDVEVLSFDGPTFARLVASDEMAQLAFGLIAGHRMTARFLKLASPFAALTPDQTRTLSKKIQRQSRRRRSVVRPGDEETPHSSS